MHSLQSAITVARGYQIQLATPVLMELQIQVCIPGVDLDSKGKIEGSNKLLLSVSIVLYTRVLVITVVEVLG